MVDQLDRSAGLRSRWEVATTSQTGIECFDAWASELVETGYLHNHARMWFASIWIFTLDLPWELGADFFLRHLLDGDPASNTLSWRWVAGLQTRGKSYLARPENIEKFTNGRFKTAHSLSPAAPPLEGPPAAAPIKPPQSTSWVRELPTGLLLTDEDLHPEFLLGLGTPFQGIAVLSATDRRSPLGAAPHVQRFVKAAIEDTVKRTQDRVEGPIPVSDLSTSSTALVDMVKAAGWRQVVTAYVPVGPTAEALRSLSTALAEHDVSLVQILRPWDNRAWPYATRGFFQFRQKIPNLLNFMQSDTDQVA